MKKMIIFDFNKTLYDPEKGKLIDGCSEILKALGSKYILALISLEKKGRKKIANKLISSFFNEIIFSTNKKIAHYKQILDKYGINKKDCFIVGDTLEDEITIGKKIGCITIHLNPKNKPTVADFSLARLKDIKKIVK